MNYTYDYDLAPDKIEIKKEMLSNYYLNSADFHNISIGTVKKLVPNFFDKEKYVLATLFKIRIEVKKNTLHVRI